ncbi:DUF2238 domain-containing protein [Pseudomonas sp. SH1-B]
MATVPDLAPSARPATALILLGMGIAVLALAGMAPQDRVSWVLESALPILLLLGLSIAWPWLRFSPGAYLAILALLVVHELGAHYTYAKVPYDQWLRSLSGQSLDDAMGWRRNQYDRLVHFSYGLLIAVPLRELLLRLTPMRGGWLILLTLSLVMSTSASYELIEWIGGEYLGKDQARAFLATQQDPWDAQKDMALALGGAILCCMISLARKRLGSSSAN